MLEVVGEHAVKQHIVWPSLLALSGALFSLTQATDASACGGCFVQNEATVVTDHRMALSISKQQTVLWDQIRYSGDPREFAWVLPVRAGTKLELANDAFFSALDAATQPVIVPPNRVGGGVGCAVAGCGASEASSSGEPGEGQVQILSQAVVGPYETVTLRATDPDALTRWLRSHAFAIPANIEPTIRSYVREGFDFIALRLAPRCGERQMRPVRVVTPGADPTLPLRMVAAGVGARVGITLYVIGEGRYHPQNFPDAEVAWSSELTWSRAQNRSNYQALAEAAMAQGRGRAWLTEFAGKVDVTRGGVRKYTTAFHPALADAYYGLCRGPGPTTGSTASGPTSSPCPDNGTPQAEDAGARPRDAGLDGRAADAAGDATFDGEADASADAEADADVDAEADADVDAEVDAGPGPGDASRPAEPSPPQDAGLSPVPSQSPCGFDDLAVATEGMSPNGVWVTRLRAVLPVDALGAGDLRLEATHAQTPVESVHYVESFSDEASTTRARGCANGARSRTTFGAYGVAAGLGVLGLAWARRRRPRGR